MITLPKLLLFLLLLTFPIASASAQSRSGVPQDDELFATLAALDKALFQATFNCDLEKVGSLVDENLEFYHDKGGMTLGRKAFVDAVKNNLCGKVRRELVAGTLEVYPMDNYGAVQMGVHRFHHPGREAIDGVGEAKFIHLWQKTIGPDKQVTWRITRVISYDHRSIAR